MSTIIEYDKDGNPHLVEYEYFRGEKDLVGFSFELINNSWPGLFDFDNCKAIGDTFKFASFSLKLWGKDPLDTYIVAQMIGPVDQKISSVICNGVVVPHKTQSVTGRGPELFIPSASGVIMDKEPSE